MGVPPALAARAVRMGSIPVVAVITDSVLHWKNTILAMITGHTRPASGRDTDHAGSARGG